MSEPEKIITELEATFPTLSGLAFSTARSETLASGQSVLQSAQGVIYEVFPDGRQVERKRIEPPTPIPAGTKVVIRGAMRFRDCACLPGRTARAKAR